MDSQEQLFCAVEKNLKSEYKNWKETYWVALLCSFAPPPLQFKHKE